MHGLYDVVARGSPRKMVCVNLGLCAGSSERITIFSF